MGDYFAINGTLSPCAVNAVLHQKHVVTTTYIYTFMQPYIAFSDEVKIKESSFTVSDPRTYPGLYLHQWCGTDTDR